MNVSDENQQARLRLARLCREIMIGAQFNSRTGYAALRINHGDDTYKDVAIDNWMAASPIYTRRMQRALGFDHDKSVETIFKGLQLDCGLSHQYFDAHFELDSPDQGRFWLESCGALLEAEPRGDDAVRVMCHDIEDPTFDATAVATNPRARMRPIHRPPRIPSDRQPHCEWRVFIDESAQPLAEPEITKIIATTRLAQLDLDDYAAAGRPESGAGGAANYSGTLQQQLSFEMFSQDALLRIADELAIQYHLLINSLHWVMTERFGAEAALAVSEFQMTGGAWVVSERLRALLPPDIKGIDIVHEILKIHPALNPKAYFDVRLTRVDDSCLRFELGDAVAEQEEMPLGWYQLLLRGITAGLESLVRGADGRARVHAIPGSERAWHIVLEEGAEEDEEEPFAVLVAKGAVLYQTRLEDNIQLLQL
jgi:hypothetical protein